MSNALGTQNYDRATQAKRPHEQVFDGPAVLHDRLLVDRLVLDREKDQQARGGVAMTNRLCRFHRFVNSHRSLQNSNHRDGQHGVEARGRYAG